MTRDDNRRGPDVNLNLSIRGMQPSPTVAINERSDALRRQGRQITKLGLGQSPFPVPRPVVEELKNNASKKDYLPVRGLPALQEAVADYHWRKAGVSIAPEDVLIGPGSKELMFLLQIVYYGELVIPTPAWVSYAPQAQIVGRNVRFLHTRSEDGWVLDPERLEALCKGDPERPRILVLNYPSNPTGGSYLGEQLEAIAAVAERHGIVLLSDEIYGELHHRGQHVSVARYYPDGTIISSGLSKWCGAGGWRLGTFAFPAGLRWLASAMAAVASETYTSTSTPIQYAAVRAFQGGLRIERYLWNCRRILAALGQALVSILSAAGVRVVRPDGAFYLFPDFEPFREALRARGIGTSVELCERLLGDTGVAVLPGAAFGRADEELTARLAYVDFDGAAALAAVETLPRDAPVGDDFLATYCGEVIGGVRRMAAWARGEGGAADGGGR